MFSFRKSIGGRVRTFFHFLIIATLIFLPGCSAIDSSEVPSQVEVSPTAGTQIDPEVLARIQAEEENEKALRAAAERAGESSGVTAEPNSIGLNSFSEPFPVQFTKRELSSAAIANASLYFKTNRRVKSYELILDPGLSDANQAVISEMVAAAVAALPFAGLEPLIIAGTSDDFAIEILSSRSLSYPKPGFCGVVTTNESYCSGRGWAAMNFLESDRLGQTISGGKLSVVAHEIFHVFHTSFDGSPDISNFDPFGPNGRPMWFIEGVTNFAGFALGGYAGLLDYDVERRIQIDEYLKTNTDPLIDHTGWELSPYGIGQAAAEYLVASVGMQRVLDVFERVGSGEKFATAFEESIGLSLADFYELFEAARSNMY
jgi:hypothetical protein